MSEPPESADASVSLAIAVLTVSDTRSYADDRSGDYLVQAVSDAGHRVAARDIVIDDRYRIRAVLSGWIAEPKVEVILVTGGTGFAGRDTTPEAVAPLLDTRIDGFGELFRQLSFAEIGVSTLQSRALGGMANRTLLFCMPGSTGACRTAWEGILRDQLDSRHRPCNFVGVLRAAGGQGA
jgi:molybdenum cofactor biosynthesis protein B